MLEINDIINMTPFKEVSAQRISKLNAKEVLLISMAKNSVFAKHSSPRDATLIVIEGCISFFINKSEYKLSKNQIFTFAKDSEHWVETQENSKFLIIR
jgi:quercetin dioxygenase-like cupin family protein